MTFPMYLLILNILLHYYFQASSSLQHDGSVHKSIRLSNRLFMIDQPKRKITGVYQYDPKKIRNFSIIAHIGRFRNFFLIY